MPQNARLEASRPRYAIVGTGGRSYLYLMALTGALVVPA